MSDKGWNSFEDFIAAANTRCNWIVLRNFEFLPENFFENDKDVDVLCDNLSEFVETMQLTKRSWGIAAYETYINNRKVPFDVRVIGDGYYDKLWQYKMLENKLLTDRSVPRMNDSDYFFSLIYHSTLQKENIKAEYKHRLLNLAQTLGMDEILRRTTEDESHLIRILSDFMISNHYAYTRPLDENVFNNKKHVKTLKKRLKREYSAKLTIKIVIIKFTPSWIINLIPVSLKTKLKRYLDWNNNNKTTKRIL